MVLFEEPNLERAESGETELSVVVVDYVGANHSRSVTTMRNQGMWPGHSPVITNVRYVALVPDEGLGYLEANDDLEVSYSAEDIADALLRRNYLPPVVFGRRMRTQVQDLVFEALGGFDFQGMENEEANREELKKIAGEDEEYSDEDDGTNPRVEELVDNYLRSELSDAAGELGMDGYSSAKKRELAEWLAEEDNSEVHDVLEPEDEDEDDESEE